MSDTIITLALGRVTAEPTKTGIKLCLYRKDNSEPFISLQLNNDAALSIADGLVKATLTNIEIGRRK